MQDVRWTDLFMLPYKLTQVFSWIGLSTQNRHLETSLFMTVCSCRAVFWALICMVHLTVCSCHLTYAFQSESTLYSCLNVKELLARSRREIWRWSDCNWTRSQNHLVLKRTLNHLAELAKWSSCVPSTYLYGEFDCMFLSCHVHVTYAFDCMFLSCHVRVFV